MDKGVGQVTRRKGRESITVKLPKDIITYKKQMGRVDSGYQNRFIGTVFANATHFKKWYKK